LNPIGAEGRICLLRLARASIREALGLSGDLEPRMEEAAAKAELAQRRGVFVTLKVGGKLRGCIGRMDGEEALYGLVAEVAPTRGSLR
jgi:AMMECR1 domain-containing protein